MFTRISIAMTLAMLCVPGMIMAETPNHPKHDMHIKKSVVTIDGKPGHIVYKSSGDLDFDGRRKTVFSVMLDTGEFETVIARPARSGWMPITIEPSASCFSKADVADVNGDGRPEVIVRTMSGDGHNICFIYHLDAGRLVSILPKVDHFGLTRFADIDHDRKIEVLSLTDPSFGFLGDFWLTIYKWDGKRYVDVTQRYPEQYDKVIRRIRRIIYDLQDTNCYGPPQKPDHNPVFGDLYFNLGRAYEFRRQPIKARAQYAIAYRLYPDAEWIANAFRRTCKQSVQ